ncbi:hypothetical protein SEUCBS140593_007423 [Sporothrix eucalyptigena]|uniref:Nuclear GTPase SLIP-GC n=1 Tax=Sporothrix eucalyptigena TaxID=1812306 RepID=A0ABP0CD35_9PEZI
MAPITHPVPATDSSGSLSVSAPRLATPGSEGSSADILTNGLDNVRLSSAEPAPLPLAPDYLSMAALAVAVESVEQGANEQEPLPETPPLSPRVLARALRPPNTEQSRPDSRRRSNRRASDQAASYDFDKEELPPHRLYSPEVQDALRNSKSLMESLAAALGSSASRMHQDERSTIHGLHKQATALANFQLPSTWTLGFVGDTGVEFRYRAGNHFTIETELFGENQLIEQLAGLVRTYRNYYVSEQSSRAPDTSGDTQTNPSRVEEEQSRLAAKEDAKEALSMLWTLFGKKIDERMPLLLGDDEDRALAALTADLLDNRQTLATEPEVFATAEACSRRLTELTVDPRKDEDKQPPNEPVKWPYIRAINVYLDSRILSKGLVLVDLPGLGDRNAAREAVTESYLVRCNGIFAVSHIGRVVSSAGVERVIDLARQAKLDNVGIVCTHAEDFGTERVEITRGPCASQVQQLFQQIQRVVEEIRELKDDLGDSEDEDDSAHGELSRAALQNKFDLHSAIRRKDVLQLRIEDRNEAVEKQIKLAYRDKLPGGIKNVFCVGNVQYWDFWKDGKFAQQVLLSGISRFRTHCLAKVADSQLVLAAKYIQDSIPALVCDVELWLESGAESPEKEQKKAIVEALNHVEGELASCWPAQTYIAFCGNYGTHFTKWAGWHSWNEEAMKDMVDDLKTPWSDVCLSLREGHFENLQQIENLLEDKMVQLQIITKVPQTLSRTMKNRNSALASDIEDCVNAFESDLCTLYISALSGIRTSLFGTAMETTYTAARLINGEFIR